MQSKWFSALLVTACVVLLSGIGFASACTNTTMDNYIVPGFSCGIDDKTFSNFNYVGTGNPPGYGIPAGSVNVSPITTPGNPGFQFSAGWFVSTSSGVLTQDSLIEYTVSVNPGGRLITDLSLSIGGVGFAGTGSIFVDEDVCIGATFPSCTGGTVEHLQAFSSADGTQLFDSISFNGVSVVDVEKDIELNAGTAGNARLSLVTQQYSEGATPEPSSILLFGSGALAFAGVLRRKLKG
jgi:PEP-CTERM motif